MQAKTSRALAIGALVAAMTTVAACSSSGSSGKSSGSTATTANLSLLGPSRPATGAPLKIGYIYAGQNQAIDTRPELKIAQATVKYINEHLNGVAGRPLQLLPCADNFSPANATDCANQMVAAHVPVVLSTEPTQPAAVMKVLEPAKIPFFVYGGIDASIFLSPDADVLSNPLTVIVAPIQVAKKSGVKKVGLVYIDLPAAAQTTGIANPLYQKQGMSVVAAAVPSGTPDMTPQIQGAVSKGAQAFLVLGDPGFCISALKAMKTLGFTGDIVINAECLSPDVAKAVPGGIDGVKVATTESLSASDPEVALYEAVAAKYAPGTPPHASGNSKGYAIVAGFARAMKNLNPNDVTAAAVAQTLLSMSPQPMPLLSGQTFQCDRKAVSVTPAVCSTGAALVTLDAAGNPKQTVNFDAKPYLNLG